MNGGQRGPQLSVLTPGKYRLNRYLWDITEVDAREVKAGFVGVIKSNVMPTSTRHLEGRQAGQVRPPDVQAGRERPAGRADRPGGLHRGMGKVPAAGTILLQSRGIRVTEIDTAPRCGPTPAATGGPTSRSPSTPRARSSRTAPKWKCQGQGQRRRAVFVKMEGWDVPLELRVVAQVSPRKHRASWPGSARSGRSRTAC